MYMRRLVMHCVSLVGVMDLSSSELPSKSMPQPDPAPNVAKSSLKCCLVGEAEGDRNIIYTFSRIEMRFFFLIYP